MVQIDNILPANDDFPLFSTPFRWKSFDTVRVNEISVAVTSLNAYQLTSWSSGKSFDWPLVTSLSDIVSMSSSVCTCEKKTKTKI